jgi:tetratricopeptide (TPR) repeat protein
MVKPIYSDAQRIGNLGKRFFIGNHPNTWQEESEPDQGGDFGFDLSMWLTQLGRVTGRFAVQLKTTTVLDVQGTEEKFISVPLARETCNLYLQDGQPVMLVLVALKDGNNAQSGTMYYVWIDAEIQRRLGDRTEFDKSDPTEMSFRIPIKNELTQDVDVSDYLKQYWTHTRLTNALRTEPGTAALGTVSGLSSRAVSGLGHVPAKSLDRWLVNDALDGDSPWATPKPGSDAAKIKQIADYITHGNRPAADRLIAEIDLSKVVETDVRSELLFQQGRRASLRGDFLTAYERFREAAALLPDSSRHFVAELETAVLSRLSRETIVPQDLLDRLPKFEQDPEVRFQLVRIRALEGNYGEAEQILSTLEGNNRYKATALYAAIREDWHELLKAIDEGPAGEPDPRQEHFLRVLQLRALLHFVTGGVSEVSIGGRPDLDFQDAKRLRDGTLEALRAAKFSGWPANSELLVDCAFVTCMVFGSDKDLLDLISDFSASRTDDHSTQVVLAQIATLAGDNKTAIAALKKIPALDPADSARLVTLLVEADEHPEAVSIAMERLLSQPHDELTDLAVVMAAMAAYKLGSIQEETALRKFVLEGSQTGRSLLEFFDSNRKSPEDRPAHIDKLWSEAIAGEGNNILQDNLFLYLRPDREGDVDRIVILSERTKARRGLTAAESAKYSAALLYQKQYDDVLLFTERAISLFPKNESIGLARAIALDHQGQSAAAEGLLRQFAGSSRKDLLQTHSTILLRVGEVETAITIVKKALANAVGQGERFHFQRALAVLYGKIDPEQYMEVAWRLGEFADQAVESEEGTFLAHFAMASVGTPLHIEENRITEFQRRMQKFSERFPESGYFRVGKLPEESSAVNFFAQLNEMLGVDERTARDRQRIRNIGERSGSYVPVALRPQGVSPYVTNVLDLLRISIQGIHEGESSKIIVGDGPVGATEFQAPPILDLVTLAALVELDLFEKLFSLWTAIAVPKISLQILSERSLENFSIGSNQLVEKAAEAIRRHREKIVQPGPQHESHKSYPNAEHSVIVGELRAGRFDFLSLDIATAFSVENEVGLPGHCHDLWNFLRFAESKGAVGADTSRLIRLRVASWNTTGVPVEAEDIVAAARGAVLEDAPERDDATAVRVVRRYLTKMMGVEAVKRAAEVIAAIAMSEDVRRQAAIGWFAKVCFREFVLAGSAKFKNPADHLASQLLVLVAVRVRGLINGPELMQPIWRALDNARVEFGGSQDKEVFLRTLGVFTANMFNKIFKENGTFAMGEEAEYRELLFSGATPGTHDRDVIEEAYFRRTSELQRS